MGLFPTSVGCCILRGEGDAWQTYRLLNPELRAEAINEDMSSAREFLSAVLRFLRH
jgi:hypothetical protein